MNLKQKLLLEIAPLSAYANTANANAMATNSFQLIEDKREFSGHPSNLSNNAVAAEREVVIDLLDVVSIEWPSQDAFSVRNNNEKRRPRTSNIFTNDSAL